jgi:outer membrane protein assembly factor BamE (lipoprotein component of BamABCDE complex)
MWLFSLLAGCDPQRIAELEEGVATEADVRARFGEPVAVYDEAGGARSFEYPRQPEGQRNYMITIGVDGKMSALRQVLTPANFARIVPGMGKDEVRRLLGRPAKMSVYAISPNEEWDWRFLDGTQNKVFTVTFDQAGRVVSSVAAADPRDLHQTGG